MASGKNILQAKIFLMVKLINQLKLKVYVSHQARKAIEAKGANSV